MKLKIGVIFGGKSVEHEISILTAVQAMNYIDTDKYEIIPIYVTKSLEWYASGCLKFVDSFNNYNLIERYATKVNLVNKKGRFVLQKATGIKREINEIHIAFPMMHGANCEDGTINGYLQMIGVPYVGNDIYTSVMCQDKVFSKEYFKFNNIPVTDYIWFYERDYLEEKEALFKKIDKLSYPLIIKPATLGSSVGIEVVRQKEELDSLIKKVLVYDHKIIIEELVKATEFNISILKTRDKTLISSIEEIKCDYDYREYKDKCFIDNDENDTIKRECPADINKKLKEELEDIALKTFNLYFEHGFCRIDFLYDGRKLYVNEVNSMPNFFSHHLWEDNNISYKELLNIMIKDCIKNKNIEDTMKKTLDSEVLKGLKNADVEVMK